jgi:hypothetical protein
MGRYLPNMITEMWEPLRDFAFFRLPTGGVRSVVALSGWVLFLFFFVVFFCFFSLPQRFSLVGVLRDSYLIYTRRPSSPFILFKF